MDRGWIDITENSRADRPPPGSTRLTRVGGVINQLESDGTSTPIGGGGFGSDTIVQLPNASSTLVNALQVTTSLTANTPGAEASKWVIKLLSAGAQVTAVDFRPTQTLFPDGTLGAPGVSFGSDATLGFWKNGSVGIAIVQASSQKYIFQSTGGMINILGNYYVNPGGTAGTGVVGSNLLLFSGADTQVGADGALATNAAVGFLDIPSCAGLATGTPTAIRSGKVALIYDSTNNKLMVNSGGTWRSTAALT